jgi:hypothetical protein
MQVSDGDSLWMWARETLVPGLYATEWYNGKKAQKGFIANMEDYLVGVPRIRLVRVKEGKEENHEVCIRLYIKRLIIFVVLL